MRKKTEHLLLLFLSVKGRCVVYPSVLFNENVPHSGLVSLLLVLMVFLSKVRYKRRTAYGMTPKHYRQGRVALSFELGPHGAVKF